MGKHTSVWTFKLKNAGNGFMISDESGNICDVFMTNDPRVAMNRARLIAAAPELLDMCREALIEFEASHEVMMLNPANRGMQPAAIIGKLRALIQKAEPTSAREKE